MKLTIKDYVEMIKKSSGTPAKKSVHDENWKTKFQRQPPKLKLEAMPA